MLGPWHWPQGICGAGLASGSRVAGSHVAWHGVAWWQGMQEGTSIWLHPCRCLAVEGWRRGPQGPAHGQRTHRHGCRHHGLCEATGLEMWHLWVGTATTQRCSW